MEYNTPYEAKPNTARIFVEDGLFSKAGVVPLIQQGKPIIKVLVNIDGIDKEIALWFDMIWENGQKTNQFKISKTGNKILTGKVKDPHQSNTQAQTPITAPSNGAPYDDDIPF
jgi:hypothetical protein